MGDREFVQQGLDGRPARGNRPLQTPLSHRGPGRREKEHPGSAGWLAAPPGRATGLGHRERSAQPINTDGYSNG
jgi:hypothetical protein